MNSLISIVFRVILILIFLSAVCFAGTGNTTDVEPVQFDVERDFAVSVSHEHVQKVVDGNTQFAFDLYHQLKDSDDNMIFSPLCLSTVLAMTWAGTGGTTKDEMRDVLHFLESEENTHKAFNMLDLILTNQYEITIESANSIWAQHDEAWKEDFLSLINRNYDAGIYNVDFIREPEQSRTDINEWVERKTKGRFRELITPGQIDELTRMILVNTLYFYGQWVNLFVHHRHHDF